MDKVKFELNYKGVGQLLKSPEMQRVLESYAAGAASRAGKGYKTRVMPTRAVVFADSKSAQKDNLEHNTLLKAVGVK